MFLDKVSVLPEFKKHVEVIKDKKFEIAARMIDDKKVTDHHAIIPTDKTPDQSRLSEQEKNMS